MTNRETNLSRAILCLTVIALSAIFAEARRGSGLQKEAVPITCYCSGTVTAVSKTTISMRALDGISTRNGTWLDSKDGKRLIAGNPVFVRIAHGPQSAARSVEFTRDGYIITPVDGDRVTVVREKQALRELHACEHLLQGKYASDSLASYSYLISDVRVGDFVALEYKVVEDRFFIHAISIIRRPKGRVPPAPGEQEFPILKTYVRHHERMNAEQDWEEKGIPIPEKIRKRASPWLWEPYPPQAPPPRSRFGPEMN